MDSTKLSIKSPLIWSVCVLALLTACLQGTEYPPEPEIKYLSYTKTDSVNLLGQNKPFVVITFEFTDGDGDIGEVQNDTTKNMFLAEFGILNGVRQTPVNLPYTIPFVTPSGQNKSLKGEIDVDIHLLTFPYDSVIYEIYIVDRGGNQSNIITTPIIPL